MISPDSGRGVVLDASALLAYLQDEPGAATVERVLERSVISSLNWSEVVQKTLARDIATAGLRQDLEAVGLRILRFEAADAEAAAGLWLVARHLSLADRACLALARRERAPALTTDRLWGAVAAGIEVRVIR